MLRVNMPLFGVVLFLGVLAISAFSAEDNEHISFEGDVVPEKSQSIRAPMHFLGWRNTIRQLASNGRSVEPGDIVARFDTQLLREKKDELADEVSDLRHQVFSFQERLSREITELEKRRDIIFIEKNYASTLALVEDGLISANEKQRHELNFAALENEFELLEVIIAGKRDELRVGSKLFRQRIQRAVTQIDDIEASILRLTIAAEISGTVSIRRSRSGRLFSMGDVIVGGALILEILHRDAYVFYGKVPQRYANQILVGTELTYLSRDSSNIQCSGEVTDIASHIRPLSDWNPQRIMEFRATIHCPDEVDLETIKNVNALSDICDD